MKKETYIKMTQPFRENPDLAKGIHIANKICTGVMYLAYPVLLVYMFFNAHRISSFFEFEKVLLVPAVSFVLLTIFRKIINRPRPYEAFEVPPVIKKDTKGHSFPSRHVFSATIIAMTFILHSPFFALGVVFLVVSLLLAVVRVVSGVHYISDVIAGVAIAIAAAIIGYLVL